MTPNTPDAPLDLKTVLSNLQAAATIQRTSNQVGKSRWPYYTEQHATEVLEIFETVAKSQTPYFWTSEVLTVNTLKARYRQGLKYALANMEDPENPWVKPLIESVQIRELEGGIRFYPRIKTTIAAVDTKWREDFEAFIAASEIGSTFERFTALSDSEVEWLVQFLDSIKDLVSHNQPNNKHIRVQILE